MSRIKPIRPSAEHKAARQRRLSWHRRSAWLAGKLAPQSTLRVLTRRMHSKGADTHGLPLAFLDACGFTYPKVRVDVATMNTQVRDWCSIASEGETQVVNTIDSFVLGGDWRHILVHQEQPKVEDEARQLHEVQLRYQQAPEYQALLTDIQAGRKVRRQGQDMTTPAQLDSYFQRFCDLFQSIQHYGLLGAERIDAQNLRTNLDRPLGVAMDADGALHRLQGGNHRWAIARVLGITDAEVELRLVHQSHAARYL